MLEGTRAFDIGWGTVTGTLCFALGFVALRMWLDGRGSGAPSLFGRTVDPGRGLHLAWGISALVMGGTNVGCRYVDHRYLAGVHEGFFALSLIVFAVLLPQIARAALTHRPALDLRKGSQAARFELTGRLRHVHDPRARHHLHRK